MQQTPWSSDYYDCPGNFNWNGLFCNLGDKAKLRLKWNYFSITTLKMDAGLHHIKVLFIINGWPFPPVRLTECLHHDGKKVFPIFEFFRKTSLTCVEKLCFITMPCWHNTPGLKVHETILGWCHAEAINILLVLRSPQADIRSPH